MSRELQVFGTIVGTQKYFSRIHSGGIIGEIAADTSRHDYHTMVVELAGRAQSAIQDVYSDLAKHAGIIRFVPHANRGMLREVIVALDGLAKFGGKTGTKKENCLSLLDLRDSRTNPFSRTPFNDIMRGAQLIDRGGRATLGCRANRMNLLRKCVASGIPQAVGTDANRRSFMTELMQRQTRPEFCRDVLAACEYSESPAKFSTLRGAIGSVQYISRIENMVFIKPDKISMTRDRTAYTEKIKSGLESIRKKIELDIGQGIRDNDYITDQSAEALRKAVAQLGRLGVRRSGMDSKIETIRHNQREASQGGVATTEKLGTSTITRTEGRYPHRWTAVKMRTSAAGGNLVIETYVKYSHQTVSASGWFRSDYETVSLDSVSYKLIRRSSLQVRITKVSYGFGAAGSGNRGVEVRNAPESVTKNVSMSPIIDTGHHKATLIGLWVEIHYVNRGTPGTVAIYNKLHNEHHVENGVSSKGIDGTETLRESLKSGARQALKRGKR